MENVQSLLTAAAALAALLVLLRWIFGGSRRRGESPAPRAAQSPAAWRHVEARRRDLASTGNWQVRIR